MKKKTRWTALRHAVGSRKPNVQREIYFGYNVAGRNTKSVNGCEQIPFRMTEYDDEWCAEIAREREAAARLAREITAEIEAQILGTLPPR